MTASTFSSKRIYSARPKIQQYNVICWSFTFQQFSGWYSWIVSSHVEGCGVYQNLYAASMISCIGSSLANDETTAIAKFFPVLSCVDLSWQLVEGICWTGYYWRWWCRIRCYCLFFSLKISNLAFLPQEEAHLQGLSARIHNYHGSPFAVSY